ncbi:UbiA prenyltransferase family-domain-containing protein [Phakopsora pachyrhizi]|nr:UbiA prenyltransferase family-domain-containing protein [Phakopsora pachyrhizi]
MFTKGILTEQGVGSSLVKRREIKISLFRRVSLYQALAKSRLSSLIVLTTMASYALCPVPDNLVTSSLTTLLATATGTYLCSASANTLNQIFETPFDAQMSRTRARPLVRRLVSLPHATTLAFSSGLTGAIVLATMVNPTTACLGVANLILYAFFYTPLKRISITNTWLGALVGAIPALMGATAAGAPLNQLSSWLPAGLLYVWQFPHFNSLAHTLRRDYCRAGYQMMSNVTAELNSRVSLRYALMTIPLCSYLVPSYGLTNQLFGWISLIPNLFLIAPAFRFWLSTPRATPNLSYSKTKELVHKVLSFEGTKARQDLEAKKLFWASLIHLPCILILMMVCKSSQSQDDNNGEIRE